jgi:hypothetical protein
MYGVCWQGSLERKYICVDIMVLADPAHELLKVVVYGTYVVQP